MEIVCPHCGQAYNADESYIGQTIECQACGKSFVAEKPEGKKTVSDSSGIPILKILKREKFLQNHPEKLKNKSRYLLSAVFLFSAVIIAGAAFFVFHRQELPAPLEKFRIQEVINKHSEVTFTAKYKAKSPDDAAKMAFDVADRLQIKYDVWLKEGGDGTYSYKESLESSVEQQELSERFNIAKLELDVINVKLEDFYEYRDTIEESLKLLDKYSQYERKLDNQETIVAEASTKVLKGNFGATDFRVSTKEQRIIRVSYSEEKRIKKELNEKNIKTKINNINNTIKQLTKERFERDNGSLGFFEVKLYCSDSFVIFTVKATGTNAMDRLQRFCQKQIWYADIKKWLEQD